MLFPLKGKDRHIAINPDLQAKIEKTLKKPTKAIKLAADKFSRKIKSKIEQNLKLSQSNRSILEGLQDIVSLLSDQLKPLVQAELSVLVDVLHHPELLFPVGTESRKKCESGGFISRSEP